MLEDQGAIAPPRKESDVLGTTSVISKLFCTPSPSHFLQAPYGLLKLKSLGSISSIVNPETGQEKFDENIIFSSLSANPTYKIPSAKLRHVSTESAILCLFSLSSFFITSLSTTTSISCFLFLSRTGVSSIL